MCAFVCICVWVCVCVCVHVWVCIQTKGQGVTGDKEEDLWQERREETFSVIAIHLKKHSGRHRSLLICIITFIHDYSTEIMSYDSHS